MKDDIKYAFPRISPETTAELRQRVAELWQEMAARLVSAHRAPGRESPPAPGAATQPDEPPKERLPVATFSELLFEKSDRPAHIMPPGLKIALMAVSKLRDVPPGDVNELIADIRHNLDWADAELRSIVVTTYSIKYWLQLEMAREQLAAFELGDSAEWKLIATFK